jgi:hypothetical protein
MSLLIAELAEAVPSRCVIPDLRLSDDALGTRWVDGRLPNGCYEVWGSAFLKPAGVAAACQRH